MVESRPCDPATHETAVRIAERCATIIDALLPPGTRGTAEHEFYKAARIELDRSEISRAPANARRDIR